MFNLFNVPLQKQIIRERKRRSQEIECVLSPAKFPLSDFVCFLSRQAGSDLGPPAGWARPAGQGFGSPLPSGQVNRPLEEQDTAGQNHFNARRK